MKKAIALMFAVVLMASVALAAGSAKVKLLNYTDQTLNLVVDGVKQCTAGSNGGSCIAEVAEGQHHFDATDVNNKVTSTSDHYITGDGGTNPWEICSGQYKNADGTCKDYTK